MKLSSFIIAMVVIGVVAVTFTGLIVDGSDKYHVDYDNDTLAIFEDTAELNILAKELENKTNSLSMESGVLDIVGSYIGRALDALKLSVTSFSVFERMASAATTKIGIPGYFLIAFITIVLILIVFAIIRVMVKEDV